MIIFPVVIHEEVRGKSNMCSQTQPETKDTSLDARIKAHYWISIEKCGDCN